jgi:hypothetical protein
MPFTSQGNVQFQADSLGIAGERMAKGVNKLELAVVFHWLLLSNLQFFSRKRPMKT